MEASDFPEHTPLDEIEEESLPFFGIDGYSFKLGSFLYTVHYGKELDGPKSWMVMIERSRDVTTFPKEPIAVVRIMSFTDWYEDDANRIFVGYRLTDEADASVVLEFGTVTTGDGESEFIFSPKQEETNG